MRQVDFGPRERASSVSDQRKETVAHGYDALVDDYLEWSEQIRDATRQRLVQEFMARLPPRGAVLDLGCGAGIPSTRLLVQRFAVTGVDISGAQIEAARRNVPHATFLQADVATLELPDGSFDGVTAFFSVIHVPREEHARLFARILRWLRPNGLFLASLAANGGPDWTGEWLGQQMFFSSFDAATNRRLLRQAGFELLVDEVIQVQEPEGSVPFLWVLARRPPADG